MSTPSRSVLLEHRATPGERRSYLCRTLLEQETVHFSPDAASAEARTQKQAWSEAAVKVRVLAVDEDGSRHVAHTLECIDAGGDTAALGLSRARQVSYDHLDARGQVLESTHRGTHCLYLLPPGPVSEGAAWEASLPVEVPLLQRTVDCQFRYHLEALRSEPGADGQVRTIAQIDFEALPPAFEVDVQLGAPAHVELAVGGLIEFCVEEGHAVRIAVGVESRTGLGDHHCRTLARSDMRIRASGEG